MFSYEFERVLSIKFSGSHPVQNLKRKIGKIRFETGGQGEKICADSGEVGFGDAIGAAEL
jgi:hypothetical protein